MKYTVTTIIKKPLEETARIMDNPDNMQHWMPGFLRYEFTEGKPGEVGSKMDLYFERGKSEIKMTETILKNNFPDEFDAIYEANGVWNKQINRFIAINENTTEWESKTEFKFSGFMKFLSFFMGKKAFQKQSQKFGESFKKFAENQ